MKKCNRCKELKDLSEFQPRHDRPVGYYARCKTCLREIQNTKRQTPEGRRQQQVYHLNRYYNMSIEDFDDKMREQGGLCAVCGTNIFLGRGKKLHIDHDHETGQVRGLLCHHCNCGLGNFKDDVELLCKAGTYLCQWKKNNALRVLPRAGTEVEIICVDTQTGLHIVSAVASL